MIPKIDILTQEITEIVYPTRTYKVHFNTETKKYTLVTNDDNAVLDTALLGKMLLGKELIVTKIETEEVLDRINGYTDGLDALAQTIYFILGTERYEFVIYSWDYGVELVDLIGQPMPYVMSELPRRIKEALTQDDRIDDVVDFEFEINRSKLHTTFTVISNVGNLSVETEVAI